MQRHSLLWMGGAQSYADKLKAIAPSNLIGYWKLNETSGTTANDSSGNGRHGTISGATLGQPGIGDGLTAMSFDGINDYLNLFSASLAAAFNRDEGTLAVWANLSVGGYLLDWRNADADGFLIEVGGTTLFHRAPQSISLSTTLNAWTHLALTWSVSSDKLIAYKNGVASTPTTGLASKPTALTHAIVSGYFIPSFAYVTGKIQHIAAWSTPLSAAQIASLAVV